MTQLRFITNNLLFYLRKNLLLALGVAISGAVLTGALMVGDSVKYSLNQIVENRLGNITHVLKAGDRYFTSDLALRVSDRLQVPVSSILLQEGSAVADGGQMRVNSVQVMGVEPSFDQMAGTTDYFNLLSGDSVIISSNLANRLNLSTGDELLLRIQRASLIPLNAPFVSDAENVVTLRATVIGIAGDEQMGRFNLKVSQTAPFNVFVSLQRLEELMDFTGRANVMLLNDSGTGGQTTFGEDQLLAVIRESFSAADAGLKVSKHEELQQIEVTSHRVFMDDVLIEPLEQVSTGSESIVTYFVNTLASGGNSAPYSFVSTMPGNWLRPDEILINSWLAEDLKAGPGDSVTMSYFVVGLLRELTEVSSTFVVKSVVPMEGRFADRSLMPDLPGLSDAGNCRDWETGVPISLESIRDKDEDYWDQYGGIPKAFISVEKGVELWKNRFGTYTAFRFPSGPGEDDLSTEDVESALLEHLDPAMLGFTLEATRNKGIDAAGSGVDFSELFGGLSFFLLVAAILLTVLLFLLNLEGRSEQLRTLVVMGIPVRTIRRLVLAESLVVALVGSMAGLVLAVFYNRAVFAALNGVWSDAVRTEMMHLEVRPATLVIGLALTMAIAFLALWFPLNRKLKRQFQAHKKPAEKRRLRLAFQNRGATRWVFASTGLAAFGLIGWQLAATEGVSASVFFAAGGLLLISVLTFVYWYLSRTVQLKTALELNQLSMKNARRNLVRSMSIVILFAIGAFLVISTGSNRKDLFTNSEELGSGTGGFLYYAESTVPVLRQLNDAEVRYEYGLGDGYGFVQLRKADGDDASCLNLNKIINPQVLGVNPAQLEGRFSFITSTSYLDEANPWGSLQQELPGGLIPAIADETVIKWGLGLMVGDTLHYTNSNGGSMELLLIGGLAPSVFQGNVLIADKRFLEQFPESSGTNVFLIEGEMADTAMIQSELGRGLRDLGWDMELTAARLTKFNSVTNTYLSIFMVLGALGLLVGTFGLVVVLSRSILERKQEIALLKAVGYQRNQIRKLIVREYMILLLAGIGTGFITAIVATLPSILNANGGTSFTSIIIWLGVLVINGWIWIQLVTRSALNNDSIYAALRNE
jgi:ABC-type antimicrobial peptide transport system permease subunit